MNAVTSDISQWLAAMPAKPLRAETVDVTLPGRGESGGSIHPVTRATDRISAIFNRREEGMS